MAVGTNCGFTFRVRFFRHVWWTYDILIKALKSSISLFQPPLVISHPTTVMASQLAHLFQVSSPLIHSTKFQQEQDLKIELMIRALQHESHQWYSITSRIKIKMITWVSRAVCIFWPLLSSPALPCTTLPSPTLHPNRRIFSDLFCYIASACPIHSAFPLSSLLGWDNFHSHPSDLSSVFTFTEKALLASLTTSSPPYR